MIIYYRMQQSPFEKLVVASMVKFPAVFKNSQESLSLINLIQSPHTHTHTSHFFQINSGYGLDDLGLESRQGQEIYLLSNRSFQTNSGAHPASYSIGKGLFPRGGDSAERETNIHLQLLPKLRNSGVIPALHHMPG
jgi:hypothetical protein